MSGGFEAKEGEGVQGQGSREAKEEQTWVLGLTLLLVLWHW